MSTRIVNPVVSHLIRFLVLVLAAFALSSAQAPAADAGPQRSAALPGRLPFTSHGQMLGLPGGPYARIEPALVWNTFLGGIGEEEAVGIAADGLGNAYVVGTSVSTWQGMNAPVRAFTDGVETFVAKLDARGALVWNTFLGGYGSDQATAVAVDANGNIYALGYSSAGWEGTTSPVRAFVGMNDAFVAKLDSSGTLIWTTFLGGNSSDQGYGIAVAEGGDIYVAGSSYDGWQGTNPPVHGYSGNYDAFVAQLDPSGTLIWNTFLGTSVRDESYALALDGNKNIYVAGLSDATWQGTSSPVRPHMGGTDAFVAKLGSSGALIWNTFLGGDGFDYGPGVAVDGSGNVFALGQSDETWQGSSPPIRPFSGSTESFVAKLSPEGALTWNTFLGGSGNDYPHGIAANGDGNAYVVGQSEFTWGSPLRAFTDNWDSFAAEVSSTGELVWNMFLGGKWLDRGYRIAVDTQGQVYIAGHSYDSWGAPVRPFTANSDGFVARIGTFKLYLALLKDVVCFVPCEISP